MGSLFYFLKKYPLFSLFLCVSSSGIFPPPSKVLMVKLYICLRPGWADQWEWTRQSQRWSTLWQNQTLALFQCWWYVPTNILKFYVFFFFHDLTDIELQWISLQVFSKFIWVAFSDLIIFQTPQHESKDKKMNIFTSGAVAMDVNLEKSGFFQGEWLLSNIDCDYGFIASLTFSLCLLYHRRRVKGFAGCQEWFIPWDQAKVLHIQKAQFLCTGKETSPY